MCVCVSVCVSLQHETASLAMFDYLVKDNALEPVMEEHGLVLPDDLIFIKEQIAGPLDSIDSPDGGVCVHFDFGNYLSDDEAHLWKAHW